MKNRKRPRKQCECADRQTRIYLRMMGGVMLKENHSMSGGTNAERNPKHHE